MKQILTAVALFAMAISFASCDKENMCNCNCQCGDCQCGDSGQQSGRPDNGGGSNNDDTSEYESYTNTFTYGYAGYCGQWYDEQPANTTNWYIELADDNYDLENYEGTGYNIVLEIFAAGTSSTNIPAGKYTVEAYKQSEFSAGSLMDGYITKDENDVEYPAGTWFFEGDNGIAGATAGWVEISGSGTNYTIKYELRDDEYMIEFKGTFSGSLTFYDATEEAASAVQASKVAKAKRGAKYFKVRR